MLSSPLVTSRAGCRFHRLPRSPVVRLALAGAVGQAREFEAVVEARALRLGLGGAAGLSRSHAPPVGDPTILTQSADRGVVDRHTSTTAAGGPGSAGPRGRAGRRPGRAPARGPPGPRRQAEGRPFRG